MSKRLISLITSIIIQPWSGMVGWMDGARSGEKPFHFLLETPLIRGGRASNTNCWVEQNYNRSKHRFCSAIGTPANFDEAERCGLCFDSTQIPIKA